MSGGHGVGGSNPPSPIFFSSRLRRGLFFAAAADSFQFFKLVPRIPEGSLGEKESGEALENRKGERSLENHKGA